MQTAHRLLDGEKPLIESSVFHVQQAAEKSIESFLAYHQIAFRKTHDISVLAKQASSIESTLDAVLRPAVVLTPFAYIFRYPEDDEIPTLSEAIDSLSIANSVYQEIKKRLS